MSITYPQLGKTLYPDSLDINAPTADTERVGTYWEINLDNIHYVLADDVTALQDAVIAIQNVLGIEPQGASTDIKTRIDDIDTELSTHEHDLRYGGATWSGATIVGHLHNGEAGQPSKIGLSTQVQGWLPRSNINLTYNAPGGLTGEHIMVSTTTNMSIRDALNGKLGTDDDLIFNKFVQATNFISTTSGNPPLTVNSTQWVENLNVDMLDGKDATDFVLNNGATRITVGPTPPENPVHNELWLETGA